jgi:uncharacterized protein (TIGR00255 family)
MIRSMTGYGRAEASGTRIAVSAECKSLNHRSLDIALRLPRLLSAFELDARRLIQSTIQRGRIEVTVGVAATVGGTLNPLVVNTEQAREYATAARRLAGELDLVSAPTVEWVLGQPGVLSREEQPAVAPEEAWALLSEALGRALAELVARREAEGQALLQDLLALHETLITQTGLIAERVPVARDRQTTRMRERMRTLLGETPVDEARLAMEMAVWATRTDITEELTRLRAHLAALARLLHEGGTVGRPLDFLIQELNREVNTIGAKADDLELSQAVIAGKSALEKLREQVQNLE